MTDEVRLNIPPIDIPPPMTIEMQWQAFKVICRLAGYDRTIVASLAETLGLDLVAIQRYRHPATDPNPEVKAA